MPVGGAVLIASLGVAAVGAYKQQQQMEKMADAQDDAAEQAANQQRNQDIENRRSEMRQERIRRAQILQASENVGTSESSSESAAISNLSANSSFSESGRRGGQAAAASIAASQQEAADAQRRGQIWGAVSQLGGQAFQSQGGFTSLFNNAAPPSGQTQSRINYPQSGQSNNLFG